jgi:hypothetical protein
VGLGPKLVQAGFPAVVAMQAQVPVETARQLSGEFYRRLMEHGVVDKAMSEARRLMFKPNRVDWGIPVLFMRLKTGALFAEKRPANESGDLVGRSNVIKDEKTVVQNVESGGIAVTTGAGDGGINFGGGNVSIGGNAAGRDIVTNTSNVGGATPSNADVNKWLILEQQFKKVYKTIDGLALDDGDKDEVKDLASKIELETKKGDGADLRKLERWLGNMGDISKEALAATVKALTNIAAKAPDPVKAVARKMG